MNTEEMPEEQVEESEGTEQEPHFTIFHAVGMIILLVVLQLFLSSVLSKTKSPMLDETGWVNLSITHAVSGVLTAQAGAILAGLSLVAMLIPSGIRFSTVVSALISVFGLSILASELSNLLQSIEPVSESYLEAFKKLFQQNTAGVLLAIGVIAPVTEELIFRGVMLEGLRTRYKLRTAIFVSTLLFALVHIFPWVVINAFLLGLFFTWIKLETGSLLLCILSHSFYNSLPFLLYGPLSVEIPGYTSMPGERIQFQPWWFDLLGAGLLILGAAGLRSLCRPKGGDLDDQVRTG